MKTAAIKVGGKYALRRGGAGMLKARVVEKELKTATSKLRRAVRVEIVDAANPDEVGRSMKVLASDLEPWTGLTENRLHRERSDRKQGEQVSRAASRLGVDARKIRGNELVTMPMSDFLILAERLGAWPPPLPRTHDSDVRRSL